MDTNRLLLPVLSLGLFAVGSTVIAQSEPDVSGSAKIAAGDAVSILRQAYGTWVEDGRPMGGGADYKAGFDAGGVEFVPALGRRAPHVLPLRLTTESIRRGAVVHALAKSPPDVAGNRVAYARGKGVVERFDVRPDGIELSYELTAPLAGSGDLVVRCRVDTELTAEPGEYPDAMSFTAEKLGGVSIGRVTGIDARGAKSAGSIRWDGTGLELVLPAGFVDGAAYPLVLDPLIGTAFDVNSDTLDWDDNRPDVAYDASTSNYLVVWHREFAADDVDVRGQLVDWDGTLLGGFITIGTGTDIDMHAAVGDVNNSNEFLVAYQTSSSLFGPFDIACRQVNASSGAVSAEVSVASTAASEITPDVSGERVSSSSYRQAIVVWHEVGAGIRAAEVDVQPGGTPTPAAAVTIAAGSSDELPAISKSGGSTGRHAIVWQRSSTFVRGGVWDRNLTALDTFNAIASNAMRPDVDGDGTWFTVVFESYESGTSGPRDVYCQVTRYDAGSGNYVNEGSAGIVEAGISDDEFEPAIGFLGEKYVCTWSDGYGFLQSQIGIRALDPHRCVLCGYEYFLSPIGGRDFLPKVGSRWAGGVTADDCLIVFGSADVGGTFESDVFAQRFEAIAAGGAVTNVPGAVSCGGGGTCSINGPFAFGATPSIVLTGADPGAGLAAIHVGSTSSALVVCPPTFQCTILDPFLVIGTFAIGGGSASTPFPILCDVSLAGAAFRFQYLVANTVATPCLGLPVGISNTIEATFGF